jgi:hypothetical protein
MGLIKRMGHRIRAWFIGIRLDDHARAVEELQHDLAVRRAQVVRLAREYEHEIRLAQERT